VHGAICGNCSAALVGPYCAQCGQHAHESSRALGALFHDAWHVITHLDGRLWQTLAALLLRPGKLTREYFAERRARYVPPARLYFVLSVLFFAVASIGPHSAVLFDVDPSGAVRSEEVPLEAQRAFDEARAKGAVGITWDSTRCDQVRSDIPGLTRPLKDACERFMADHGRSLAHAFVASLPKMMFVFLPFMALVMLPLYWWPRRLYVEHLVFFLHTHAAVFLLLLLGRLVTLLARWQPALARAATLFSAAVFAYLVWYVYKAMRVYYAQGRLLTLVKLTIVGFAYMVFLSITMVITALTVALID